MKKSLITMTLAGLAGAALSVSTANAQVQSPPGDLILGFFATSGTGAGQELEVDIGNAASFDTTTTALDLTGSSALAQADLVATYGSNWFNNPDLFWGVIGGNGTTAVTGVPVYSIWGSDPVRYDEVGLGVPPGTLQYPPPNAGIRQQQSTPSLTASGVNGAFTAAGQMPTTNSSASIVIPQSQGNSFATLDNFQPGTSFQWMPGNFAVDNPVTDLAPSGASTSLLYGWFTNNAGNPPQLLGTLTLTNDFGFTFTPVPEPSSIGLTGVGFLSLIGFVALRRRRSITA